MRVRLKVGVWRAMPIEDFFWGMRAYIRWRGSAALDEPEVDLLILERWREVVDYYKNEVCEA